MRRCGRCALVAGVIALLLGPLFLLLAKGSIDGTLRDDAAAALTAQGINAVTAASDWGAVTLTGPADAKAAALAAVDGMADRSGVETVSYVAGDAGAGTGSSRPSPSVSPSVSPSGSSSPSPSPSPSDSGSGTASPAAPVSVVATVSGTADPRTIELTGTVQSPAQHKALVDAATAAYGAANVTDKITIGAGGSTPADDSSVTALASVLSAFGPAVASGTATLTDTALSVTATAKDAAAASTANAALTAAGGAGVTVTGTVTAPAAAAGSTGQQVSDQLAKILAVRGVTFDTNSATLTPAGTAILDQIVAVLAQAPAVRVLVAGHTDNQGTAAQNQVLSAGRAAAVKAYLVSHTISADRISTAAFGATRPIAGNDTPAGRLANRRIDLTVVGS